MGFNIMDLQKGRSATVKSKADEGRNVLKYIDVEDLEPSADNFYSMGAIDELATLIELSGGVKQPALVTPLGGGKYRVIAGHRRRLASIQLVKQGKEQYRKMPCMVEDVLQEQVQQVGPGTDADELRAIDEGILLITTNGQREKTDWDKVQEASRLRELLDRKRKFEKIPGETRKLIAEQLGTTPAQVGRYDSIAKHLIPEFTELLAAGKMKISMAYELSTMTPDEQREALCLLWEKDGILFIDDVKRLREELRRPEPVAAPVQEQEKPAPVERETEAALPAPMEREPEPVTIKATVVRDVEPGPVDMTITYGEPAPATEPERMSNTRARMVLGDLVEYCELEAETDSKWNEYILALNIAIDALRGR